MERLLVHFVSNPDAHLSDEHMADLFCGELPMLKRWAARRHLASCVDCQGRYEDLVGPRAERAVKIYRESLDNDDLRLTPRPRAAFAQWLQLQLRYEAQRQRRFPAPRQGFLSRIGSVLPAVSAGVMIGLATGLTAISFWWWEYVPNITANTLLVRAERWDAAGVSALPGVARQTVQIKTAQQTIKRSVYWDLQGKHRPRQTALSATEEQLRSALGQAGVNWDQPISASAYQAWHDRQHVRSDRIVRSGMHLLTLTTTVPDGAVSEESLTVRDTDFHPVEQKVGFRNSDTVEIAELDFAVLPWNQVDANAFEPLADTSSRIAGPPFHVLPHLQVPEPPSSEQLDETELAARLILNQLHADTGEQIEIHRSPQAVEVNGLVETDERKHELIAELLTVPRLKVSIQSAAHLLASPSLGNKNIRIEAASLPDQPSALAAYMLARGSSMSDTNMLAESIFSDALAISQEAHAIADLETRFVSTGRTSVIAKATLEDLLYSHRARLQVALRQERLLLVEAGHSPAPNRATAKPARISLVDEASRNLALSKELTQTNAPATRGAESIITDMFSTTECMTVALGDPAESYDDSVQDARE
jgi:hypothetical protein